MTIIDDIKSRIKLEDLVNEEKGKAGLRRSGASLTGFCPFHDNTKTPSFVIWPATQTWRCFGSCNMGGDVFDYVLAQNPGWDMKEAIRHIAEKAGIEIKPASGPELKARLAAATKEDTLKLAHRIFVRWLVGEKDRKSGEVLREPDKAALDYALDRGWTLQTIKAEGIGFSGRATAAQVNEMRGEFTMHGIDPESPAAVLVLGYRGDVRAWAEKQGLDPNDFGDNFIQGIMSTPGLVYAHRFDGKIEYFSLRFLPGFDKDRKSHNPSAALAGPKRPYFNRLYRGHHSEGQERGRRVHIVEGQGDAVTWGQYMEPAVALCGSSWRTLEKSGVLAALKEEYKEICYTTDADTPGETVVVGEKKDFPLSTAFGPTLWVERMPKNTWERPDGHKKTVKDVNDLAQYANDAQLHIEDTMSLVNQVIEKAEPIVLLAARLAGEMGGQVKQDALDTVLKPMLIAMPDDRRVNLADSLAEALYPAMSKTNRREVYNRWIKGLLKEAQAAADDDDDTSEEPTLGGWYPDDETENSGYLVEIYYNHHRQRIEFAYARITDMKAGEREIKTAPFLVIKGKKLVPSYDENIECGAVKLASGLGELKSSAELISLMAKYYAKFFYLEEKSRYRFCASYALFTWVHDCFEALNFLRARGGSGSGKSDLMYLVGLTSYRFAVTLSISSSASYKGIAKLYRATVMIDEADNLMKKDDGTMEAFLKGRSMKRYSNAMNMMEVMGPNGKTFVPTTTNVYGPTLITMYHSFKDPGIENRCVTFDLSQVDTFTLDQHDIEPGYYPPELEIEGEQIRNMALRWRLQNWQKKIELSPEQRKQHKLADPLVSPRVNQVLRPMKVLAVLQNDMDLLEELKQIGQANYEDEMIKRAGSFEALVLRAVVAADIAADVKAGEAPAASAEYAEKVKGYGDKVKVGKVGVLGVVRYMLYKDVAEIANQMMDVENTNNQEEKKREGIKGKTIGEIARESFRMPVHRTNEGWAVILDRPRIDIAKLRYGLDREADYKPAPEQPKQEGLVW